jgi:ribose transport system permease protein
VTLKPPVDLPADEATNNDQPAGLHERGRGWRSSVRDMGVLVIFLGLFLFLSFSSDAFLTQTNLLNILDQWAPIGIIACAATIVIIGGGFDLSVGAIAAIAAVVAARVSNSYGVEVGFIAALISGVGLGLANGLIVTIGRVNSFILTLATGIMFRGAAVALSGGMLLTVDDSSFTELGQGEALGVKWTIWLFGLVAISSGFLLTRTMFGRYVKAIGGNVEAARLSGVRIDVIRTVAFTLSGLAGALAGLIVASRVGTGQAQIGTGFELTAIAAVVIGGTSIAGGQGAIWRTIVGVLLLALIGNGFNLLAIDPTYQDIVQGLIIVVAVVADVWLRRARRT